MTLATFDAVLDTLVRVATLGLALAFCAAVWYGMAWLAFAAWMQVRRYLNRPGFRE